MSASGAAAAEPALVRFAVRGHVQGVGFRYATMRTARQIGLVGRVRNLANGEVEVDAAGTPEQLRQLGSWLRHGGPPAAMVAVVREAALVPPDDLWTDFKIER